MGLNKLERYSHGGYLIKVVAMAVAGEVTREPSPILSWSNNNYDLKLGKKARERGVHFRGGVGVNVVMFGGTCFRGTSVRGT
jgi:hypothetical protein